MLGTQSIADVLAKQMAVYLGPHTARVAVKTFSQRALGRGPETLTLGDVPALVKALSPMLRTLVGRVKCAIIVEQINRSLGLK